jgi:DNA-binding Lrp family transcriptional regulator
MGRPVRQNVDMRDVAILQRLFRDPRAPYAELGSAVGLSPNAAKARVARMQATGLLRGFAAAPDAALLGLADGLLVFQGVDDLGTREQEILAGLPDVPGVRFVDSTLEGNVHVWVQHRDDADWERIERAAISLVGKPPTAILREPRRESAATLAPTDWRLLRALVPDPRASLKDITERSGISFKTAKRRLAALFRDGRVRMEPVLSPSDAEGLVVYQLCVVLAPDSTAQDVLAQLPETAIAQSFPGSRLLVIHAARSTLRDAQLDHRALQSSPHCERVLFAIGTRRRADAWLDDAIAAKLSELTAPKVAAAPNAAPIPVPRTN